MKTACSKILAVFALVLLVVAFFSATSPSARADDQGFTVFYADKNYAGFAAHAYENQSYPNLGSLDNKASSLVSHTDYSTCVYDGANFTGAMICFSPGAAVPDLGAYGWDNRISSIKLIPIATPTPTKTPTPTPTKTPTPTQTPTMAYKVWIPEERVNWNTWASSIYVRNDGSAEASIRWKFYNESHADCTADPKTATIPVNGRLYYNPNTCNNSRAYGYVESSQPVSVLVIPVFLNQGGLPPRDSYGAYEGIASPTTQPLLPLLYKNYEAWNSRIRIQNTETLQARLCLDFYQHESATRVYSDCSLVIDAERVKDVDLRNVTGLGSSFVGSAVITPVTGYARKLAVVTAHERGSTGETALMMAAHSSAAMGVRVYAPLMHKDNYGWSSSLSAQNGSASAQTFTFAQYKDGTLSTNRTVNGYSTETIDPADPLWPSLKSGYFSADVAGGGNKSGVVRQYVVNSNFFAAYSMPASTSTKVTIPYLNTCNGTAGEPCQNLTFDSGLVIQNTENYAANATVSYYHSDGRFLKSDTYTIPALQQLVVYKSHINMNMPPFPSNPAAGSIMHGSAVVTSDRRVVVTVNVVDQSKNQNGTGRSDGLFSYTGTPR